MPLLFMSTFRAFTTSKWPPGTAGRGGTISTWQSPALTVKLFWICSLNYLAPSQLDLEDLKEPQQKKAHTEVAKFEEKMLRQEGMPDTSKETILYLTSLPIPTEFGLEKEFHPTIGYLEEPSKASGKMITKTYYNCTVCSKRSQNKDSMFNHARHHLNIVIRCAWPECGKKYEAPEGLEKHVPKKHRGLLAPEALSKEEAEAVVVGLLQSK